MVLGLALLLLFLYGRALLRVRWGYHLSRLAYQILVLRYRILRKPIPSGYYLDKSGVWKISRGDQ